MPCPTQNPCDRTFFLLLKGLTLAAPSHVTLSLSRLPFHFPPFPDAIYIISALLRFHFELLLLWLPGVRFGRPAFALKEESRADLFKDFASVRPDLPKSCTEIL
ncbi:hypothetical protein SUGI_1030560 [Cryptomeria japonica]|nr:hypothetical protein SUGI_1030560 [Cryptomeria japonica]